MHLAKNKVTKTCLYDATAFTLNLIKHSFCNALLINDTFYYLKKMQCEKGHDLVTYLHQVQLAGSRFSTGIGTRIQIRILMLSAFFVPLSEIVEKYHLFLILLVRKADSIRTLQEFLLEFRSVKQLASPLMKYFDFRAKRLLPKVFLCQ